MTNLALRLQDVPGVASVVVDLDDTETEGINVRLDPGVDEAAVMGRIRALLVAYGVRSANSPRLRVGRSAFSMSSDDLGVDVRITPIKGGARVEVIGRLVRSFRIVPPNPSAIAQGVSDAWCQVVGKIPLEIVRVNLGDGGELSIVASNGSTEIVGRANVSSGWETAIAHAVGQAIGLIGNADGRSESRLASSSW